MAASQSRSRCVLAPIALPFSTASRPRLSVAASNGPTSGFGRWLTAMPQYAIAQLGSVSGIAVNALIVSGKKKEWSIARARSNCCCASGEQVVLKRTRPSFSPRVFAESSCAAAVVAKTKAVRTTTREVILRLISRLQGWRVGRPSLPHRRSFACQRRLSGRDPHARARPLAEGRHRQGAELGADGLRGGAGRRGRRRRVARERRRALHHGAVDPDRRRAVDGVAETRRRSCTRTRSAPAARCRQPAHTRPPG